MKISEIEEMHKWLRWTKRSPFQTNLFYEADCEILKLSSSQYLALTSDSVSEELLFGLYKDPKTVARIAAVASLSDLCAVGVQPMGVSSSILWPLSATDEFKRTIQEELVTTLDYFSVPLLGGDSGSARDLSVTTTGLGLSEVAPSTRKGASPGDIIVLLGEFGIGPALAFSFLNEDEPWREKLEQVFFPKPSLECCHIISRYATSAMDTSDGFMTTLSTLLHLNNVSAEIDVTDFKVRSEALQYCSDKTWPWESLLFAEHGDFNVLMTLNEEDLPQLAQDASSFQVLGVVKEGSEPQKFVSGSALLDMPFDYVARSNKRSIDEHQKLLGAVVHQLMLR
ncbi:MAG: hypothetical protein KDD61_02775 [Bdellovibrionales bacterium]|nr:hypothetical protein [Bdellovibrionales bacterium]